MVARGETSSEALTIPVVDVERRSRLAQDPLDAMSGERETSR